MKSNIFDEARQMVSARSAAEYYGFQPNRSGYICCPFHGERTASLKLYENGSWYCFGCNIGGSSIDFTAKLFNLAPMDAVRRLNKDFQLALPLDTPPGKEELVAAQRRREVSETYQLFQRWRDSLIRQLNACFRLAHLTLKSIESLVDLNRLTAQEALAIQWFETLEYWSDCLMSDSMEQQMQIFRDRREIEQLCKRILNSMSMKSSAA